MSRPSIEQMLASTLARAGRAWDNVGRVLEAGEDLNTTLPLRRCHANQQTVEQGDGNGN